MRFRVFEDVPLDCLVLVWFVHAIDCLLFVGSDMQMQNIAYEPKAIFFCSVSTFGLFSTIVDRLKVSHFLFGCEPV